ncbi:MAG: thermonuclease family protein [Pseudomonadota bacterium]
MTHFKPRGPAARSKAGNTTDLPVPGNGLKASSRTRIRPAWTSVLLTLLVLVKPVSVSYPDIYTWTGQDGVQTFSNITRPPLPDTVTTLQEKSPFPTAPDGMALDMFKVTAVFDGDTLKATGNRLTIIVRLAGIDTPETGRRAIPGQPFSQTATRMLKQMVLGKTVAMKGYGTGGYNRVLAELFVGTANVNLELVRAGLAEVYKGTLPKGFDPGPYFHAQARAQHLALGMWSLGPRYESPKQWRHKHPRQN